MHRLVFLVLSCLVGVASAQDKPTFRSVELDGTTLKITMNDGSVVPRETLVGAVLALGKDVKVRIDQMEVDARDSAGEIVLHQFAIQPPGSEQWGNPCPPDAEGRRQALLIAGTWDQQGRRTSTEGRSIACTVSPQAKCIRAGYKPWKSAPDGRSLAEWHRACVQAVRGDYCGDGKSTAPPGATLDLSDGIGVLRPGGTPSLEFEAAWSPDGAVCVRHTRGLEPVALDALATQCPRLKDRLGAMCTAASAPGLGTALVFTRSIPR